MVRNYYLVIGGLVALVVCVVGLLVIGREDTRSAPEPYPTKGLASWYSSRATASGERFDSTVFTCALRKRGFGGYYQVCNDASGNCVVVRHNDFGPAKGLFNQGRIVDLSEAAFSRIADLDEGVISVQISLYK
jgi:rare lipoprotein A